MLNLLRYLKPHRNFALFTLFFAAINNVLTLGFPLLLSEIINEGINKGDLESIKSDGIIMLVCCFIAMLVSIANSYCSSKVSTSFAGELRADIFNKVESFSQGDIDKIGIPSLITRTINDIRQVQDFILMSLRTIISVPIMLIGGTVMAVIMDPGLSLVLLIVLPVIAVIALLVAKKILPFFDKIQKKVDKLNLIIREKISGIRVIRAFNRTKHEDKRFKDANDDLTGMVVTVQRIFASLIPIVTLLAFLLIILLVAIGYVQINRLTDPVEIQNTIGDLQAFIIYLVFVVIALTNAAAMFIMLPRAKISANRINDVLELQPEMEIFQKEENNSEKGVIEFRNVSFKYKNSDGEYTDVLKNVSFTANPGKVTAIIGGTGSGKSTILNLIPRFYDVADGAVFLDGYDVRQMDFASIYSKIGYIPQQAFLFSGTIADNLRYGKEDATDAELWHALEIAQAKDFVEKLPDGLYSMISQNGTNLSGGQKQRLCIARAIVKEALFYMFDDSFSALDFATDARLRRALKENLKNSSILIVAQRVGTIIDADKIIVLDRGQVVGTGTHEELLQSCDVYKDIVASQLSEEEATE
ncbi:MAG: ABC transporter ATP-binding protein [Acutalibacteraceae bacterium]|nr:ABC transporter ATP-binding protein [Acutalibacteraceae bacterium]